MRQQTIFTAEWALKTAKHLLKTADAHSNGAYMSRLAAVVFGAFAVEGAINHAGALRMPESWSQVEKSLSIEQKLALLCELAGVARFDKSRRPWSNCRELFAIRNDLAHPKLVRDKPFGSDEGKERWQKLSPARTEQLMEDAESMVRAIHDRFETGHSPGLLRIEESVDDE